MPSRFLRFVVTLLTAGAAALAADVALTKDTAGHWQLARDGRPFTVHGVGGWEQMQLAATIGVTTIRTWGAEDLSVVVDGKPMVDRAHELGLAVVAGLWVKHERQGINYDDPGQLQAQRERIRAEVRQYRNHPAIIVWGLGNEMEGPESPTGPERIWREVEILARIVKEEDPHRPVMTTIAGAAREKIEAVRQFCPSLDLLGLNLYGGAPAAVSQLDKGGWDRPFMLTEFGPLGPWEVRHTSWDAPIEPDTNAKVANYLRAYRAAMADPRGRCVGTFAFLWGQKQEATATWFGMFLPTGEKTPIVDAMGREFTGRWPANRSPQIEPLRPVFANEQVRPGAEYPVEVTATDPEHDALTYEWVVQAEATERKVGGDPETAPPVHPECIIRAEGSRAVLRMPVTPGAYRLFVYVRDGQGGGCSENVAFNVQP